MLSFRPKKQTSKNVTDTTFKERQPVEYPYRPSFHFIVTHLISYSDLNLRNILSKDLNISYFTFPSYFTYNISYFIFINSFFIFHISSFLLNGKLFYFCVDGKAKYVSLFILFFNFVFILYF